MAAGGDDRQGLRARPMLGSLAFAIVPVAGLWLGAFMAGPEEIAEFTQSHAIIGVGLYAATALIAYAFLRFGPRPASKGPGAQTARPDPAKAVGGAAAGFLFMAAVSLAIACDNGADIAGWFAFEPRSLLIGLAAAGVLSLLLMLIMKSPIPFIRDFRERQIRLFVERNFDFTFGQVLIMSAGAGIAEEMLFRGALQPLLQGWAGPIGGLALASLLFGLAHAANVGYFLISTVIGLLFGWLYMWTGDLVAPIVAHGLYDVYALQVTAVAVRAHKAQAAAAA